MAFQYRVSGPTICRIVRQVTEAIWAQMASDYAKAPSTPEEWRRIASEFQRKWQFPNCLGALDGKHVRIQAPKKSGSLYFNYKGYHSIVLLAVVDANYRFLCIDVGAYGRNSDAGIYSSSNLGHAIADNTLNFPTDEPLPGKTDPVPYVMVGDEAFPLQRHLLRPFPGRNCPLDQMEFNYRLSRARRMVESAFGLLVNRFRIFRTEINVQPQVVNNIVKATCVLHNLLQAADGVKEFESEENEARTLLPLQRIGHHGAQNVIAIRKAFMDYFVENRLDYQLSIVQRGTLHGTHLSADKCSMSHPPPSLPNNVLPDCHQEHLYLS